MFHILTTFSPRINTRLRRGFGGQADSADVVTAPQGDLSRVARLVTTKLQGEDGRAKREDAWQSGAQRGHNPLLFLFPCVSRHRPEKIPGAMAKRQHSSRRKYLTVQGVNPTGGATCDILLSHSRIQAVGKSRDERIFFAPFGRAGIS